jgi:DNA mismatch endonuclease (patch repair protein)
VAVFADGCFWHGHDCRKTVPQTNAKFWLDKITKNKKRDRVVNITLRVDGWRVVRFWECELDEDAIKAKMRSLTKALSKK